MLANLKHPSPILAFQILGIKSDRASCPETNTDFAVIEPPCHFVKTVGSSAPLPQSNPVVFHHNPV